MEGTIVDYRFEQGSPVTEEAALAEAAEMGFHALAYDLVTAEDEPLHWHEFDAVTWVISGTGAFAVEDGTVTETRPGCRVEAPAGWLHRNLAGPTQRIVVSTNLPGEQWTTPIDKDPAERPAHLVV
jgi:gentisate 1,2-dioxygenase